MQEAKETPQKVAIAQFFSPDAEAASGHFYCFLSSQMKGKDSLFSMSDLHFWSFDFQVCIT